MLRFFILAVLLFFTGCSALLTISLSAKLIIGYLAGTGAATTDVYVFYAGLAFLSISLSATHSLITAKDF